MILADTITAKPAPTAVEIAAKELYDFLEAGRMTDTVVLGADDHEVADQLIKRMNGLGLALYPEGRDE